MSGISSAVRLVGTEQRPVVERLWQLYVHDLSEFRGSMPDADGLFKPGRLPSFFDDADRAVYLLGRGSAVAGFAMLRGLTSEVMAIGEFFVVRAARRAGLGHEAALALIRAHPGLWEIAFQEANAGAARFWRRVATEVAGSTWREELRPVPGKPQLPPDSWLMLVSGTEPSSG